jgi:hypothetical protein
MGTLLYVSDRRLANYVQRLDGRLWRRVDWAPVQDGLTVLFCGYAGPLIVAMFGSSENVTGLMASSSEVDGLAFSLNGTVLMAFSKASTKIYLYTVKY